jgi:hypothetical protein
VTVATVEFFPSAELLLDSDGGRNAGKQIDVRLRHNLKKLPGISGKAVEVAPLSFRVNDIESQRGFARPASPVMTTN